MANTAHTGAHHEGHHITPQKTLLRVFVALLGLTVFTVLTAQLDLGAFNVPLALTIAIIKAALVVLFFMALKYDNRVNALVFFVGTAFVVVFLTFTLFDTLFRGDLGNVGADTIMDTERREELLRQRDPDPSRLRVAPADFAGDTTATASAPADTSATAPADTSASAPADTSATAP